jgi:hypothetical protein
MMRSWLRTGETERTVKSAVEPGKGSGSDYPPPRKQSPWRKQIIGALIGLGIFIIVAGILMLLAFFR